MKELLQASLGETIVSDGGWSTVLAERGAPAGAPAELANLTHPHLVTALAREYAAAGARILTTNTFGANRFAFERGGVEGDLDEINRRGAMLSHQVAKEFEGVFAAGVIGPSGTILAVHEADTEALRESFGRQARALADGGAEGIVLETFTELAEALLALEAVKEAVDLPVVASMSFDSGPQRTRTMMGSQADECASALEEAGADAVGCNCGAGIATFLPATVALRANTKLPVWLKPNAGLPDLTDGRATYSQTPDEFGHHVGELLEAGANIIGGCCGVGPGHVKRLAALAASRKRKGS